MPLSFLPSVPQPGEREQFPVIALEAKGRSEQDIRKMLAKTQQTIARAVGVLEKAA